MEINGEEVNGIVNYADLGLSEAVMKAIEKKGYVQATPVQAGAIPYFMEWKDVIAKAPTGTGKTFVFGTSYLKNIISIIFIKWLKVKQFKGIFDFIRPS